MQGKKIILGVTGSIAAYKSALLTRLLVKAGAEVKVIMTPSALDFITPLTLSTLSKNPGSGRGSASLNSSRRRGNEEVFCRSCPCISVCSRSGGSPAFSLRGRCAGCYSWRQIGFIGCFGPARDGCSWCGLSGGTYVRHYRNRTGFCSRQYGDTARFTILPPDR